MNKQKKIVVLPPGAYNTFQNLSEGTKAFWYERLFGKEYKPIEYDYTDQHNQVQEWHKSIYNIVLYDPLNPAHTLNLINWKINKIKKDAIQKVLDMPSVPPILKNTTRLYQSFLDYKEQKIRQAEYFKGDKWENKD